MKTLERALDPVCGMAVDPQRAAGSWEYKGQTYYFCHVSCLERFRAAPESFLAPEQTSTPASAHGAHAAVAPQRASVVDPVCGMTIDPATAAGTYDYRGTRYYFCNPTCLHRFKADPESFLGNRGQAATAAAGAQYVCPMDPEVRQDTPGACPKCGMALEPDLSTVPTTKVEYTCPMHPEIVRDEPGSCPICGMALEPRTVTLEELPNPELVDMTRRMWIGALLGAPVFPRHG
jgi:Cu+-exporting ATPase